jgi:hypothetical protein
LEKNLETHKIDIKQLEGIYIYQDNTISNIKDEVINNALKCELNFLSEPFNIEYIMECPINQLPLYLLSNKRYKITIDPHCIDTVEWFTEKFCIQETLTKTENCILVKITSENNKMLLPQPPIIMAIQGVLCYDTNNDNDNDDANSDNDDERNSINNKKRKNNKDKVVPIITTKMRLELIPLYSCMELENIIDIINEYKDNIAKMQILTSLTEEQIRIFSQHIYSLIASLQIIPNHIFVEFFTRTILNVTSEEKKSGRPGRKNRNNTNISRNNSSSKNKSLEELKLEKERNYSKDLHIDKELLFQDIYKTPKQKKNLRNSNKKEEPFNIFDENDESYEIRYLILKKLLETSSKEIMEKRKKEKELSEKKDSSSFNFETGVVNKIKRNIKRSSSPAPSDSSTLSTLSVLSLQRKINEKSNSLLYSNKKTLLVKKKSKSKSNATADKNKMKLWHLTKKAVANALKIDPTDENFNTTRTKVYRSCIYALREKMNKEEISNEKLKQIVDYQVNLFNII